MSSNSISISMPSIDGWTFTDQVCAKVEQIQPVSTIPTEDWQLASMAVYEVFCAMLNCYVTQDTLPSIKQKAIEMLSCEERVGLHPHFAAITSVVLQIYDQTFEELQAKEACDQMLANMVIEGSEEFQRGIEEDIAQLSRSKTGRELFLRIQKTGQKPHIHEDSISGLEHETHKIGINPNENCMIQTLNQNGELVWVKQSKYMILGHELIHFLHFAEEDQLYSDFPATMKGFPDLEEQYAVTGCRQGISDTVSERALEKDLNLPVRERYYTSMFPEEDESNLFMNRNGYTRLHEAAGLGMMADVRRYLLAGIDTEARTQSTGITALHMAVKKGELDAAESLLLFSADVNAQTNSGDTALHFALQKGDTEMIKLLLRFNARIDIENQSGVSVYKMLMQCNNVDILALFNQQLASRISPIPCSREVLSISPLHFQPIMVSTYSKPQRTSPSPERAVIRPNRMRPTVPVYTVPLQLFPLK